MDNIFSAVTCRTIPGCIVAKAFRKGTSPEDEVINYIADWCKARGVDLSKARKYGFDVPVSKEEQDKGWRGYACWVEVPEHIQSEGDVQVEPFAGGMYAALRITEPFAAPFDRIPAGWQELVKGVREKQLPCIWQTEGSCLEEVVMQDGACYMDVFIQVKEPF